MTLMIRSVRFRITLLYTGILTLTLLFFSLVVYQYFSRSLRNNLDDLLKSKAEGVSDSIETYWDTEKMDIILSGAKAGTLSKVDNINFLKIARRWMEEKSDDPALVNIIVQIFRSDGALIAASKNLPEIMALSPSLFRSATRGKNKYYNLQAQLPAAGPLPLRLFLMPVMEKGRVTYIVQVSSPLSSLHQTLNRLKAILFLILPMTVILTGVAGLVLVRQTLKPADNMVKTLNQIKNESLGLRLPVPRTRDEIQRLARTFNDLLAKIEKDFLTQQQFNQDLSHELRTPLTVLKGELEVTLKKIRSPQEYESILESSLEEINRINKILDQLLMLARFDNKEISPRFSVFDLTSFTKQIVEEIQVLAKPKHIRLKFRSRSALNFAGDENQLRTVLLNLLDNAIKYTPPQGQVDVELAAETGSVKIIIRDTGMGIADDKLPYIYDRFFRVEDARNLSGFGLGLSIVKSIVDAHRGTIDVESRLGRGTAFTLTFPQPNH
jgi:two-component system OmpR family sensor kinase